ncbi:MAG: sensor histidine kinase, partial [Gemmatimonadaceae bacterium]
ITERKRSAEDLVVARETAESANKAKAGFLAAVSHELRTPLNAITGYVDLLSLELAGPLTEKQRGILSRISHSQRHLLLLIEDVLGFAQVEAGRLSFDLQPVVVADALASIEPIVGADLIRRGLSLEIAGGDSGIVARADPDKLRQILLNLVTNAIKFTDPPGAIIISAQEDGANVRLSVSDTGIGIPEHDIARVFNPFFQVHQGPTRRYGGLGLGLSIVRDIAEGMNGDVEIESTVGKGTVVSVILPRLEIAAPALAS